MKNIIDRNIRNNAVQRLNSDLRLYRNIRRLVKNNYMSQELCDDGKFVKNHFKKTNETICSTFINLLNRAKALDPDIAKFINENYWDFI